MIQYRAAIPADYNSIKDLLIEVGWEKYVRDNRVFQQMMENSDRTVIALERSSVVGFARAICDESLNGYITMVAVSPNKRRQGIATRIVRTLMGENPNIKWVLTSDPRSVGFWQKQGFIFLEHLMTRPRAIDSSSHEDTSGAISPKKVQRYGRKFIKKLSGKIQQQFFYLRKFR
jgi:N-acetylglutamate synthase-like GNAT family acetyltransferase